jgi:hypothetical protein
MTTRGTHLLAHDDRVLPMTRVVSIAIVPFLLVAFVVLYVWPGETKRLFAWTIVPPLTPLVLGSVYLGGAYFFVRAARASRWHVVKAGFPPVATFATLMGIATVLHWEKFNHAHVAFWLWAGLYFTTPFLVAAVWIVNRRVEERGSAGEVVVPELMARVIAAVGVLAAAMSLFLFLFPATAIEVWPWRLTPLTARVMGAIFALGIAAIGALTERRWSAMRVMLQVEVFMLALILLGGVRAGGDLDPANLLTWLFAGGFAGLLVASVAVYARMEQRSG